MSIADQISKLIQPLAIRIRMCITRAVIKSINDNTNVQQMCLGLFVGELKDKVERFQEYGLTSVPLHGMEALTVFIGGDRNNGVIVAVGDRQFRLKGLKGGEVALYTDEGDTLIMKRDHNIECNTETFTINANKIIMNAKEKVELNTMLTESRGDIKNHGNIEGLANIKGVSVIDTKGSMQKIRDTYNSHTHISASPGSPTGSATSQM